MWRHLLFILFASMLLAETATAQSDGSRAVSDAPDPEAELAAWLVDPAYPVVERLYRRHGILPRYDPDTDWPTAELEAIERGAEAVPRAVVKAVDRPIYLERIHRPCLFGIGRYNAACPAFRRNTFRVYDLPPLQGAGLIRRLAPLDRQERRELQRRRLAVHALLYRFDEQVGWSETDRWRQINGWESEDYARNRDRWAYSRYLGTRSPRLDLVTFAESFFVRPEDILSDGERHRLDPDMSLRCQEFTKARFIKTKLADLAAGWKRSPRWFDECPAFEKWARPDDLEGIDLLLAAASADRPESLYGHLLIHVRYESGAEGFEPVYQFGAVTDTDVGMLEYFSKGLFGGFYSVMEVFSFRSVDRLFLQYEQRSLRRYALNLTEAEKRQTLQRIWEVERRYRFEYYFLQDNCASFLMEILQPAIDVELEEAGAVVVAPTDVLDALAATRTSEGEPLLRKRPEEAYSSREVAQDAIEERAVLLEEALARLDESDTTETIRDAAQRLDDSEPSVRAEAYEEIEEAFLDALEGASRDTHILAVEYLYLCARIERYFMEVATYRARSVRAAASGAFVSMTAEEILERRRRLYATEDLRKRQKMLLEWTADMRHAAVEGPFREFTEDEQEVLDREAAVQKTFRAALEAEGAVIDAFVPDLDAVALLDRRHQTFVTEQERRDRLAVGPSGKSRMGLAGGYDAGDADAPIASLSYSFILERLGEQRRRGFRSDIESRSLGVDVRSPIAGDFLERLDVDFTLLSYLSVESLLGPIQEDFLDVFGWGFDVGGRHDGRRNLSFEANASVGLAYPILSWDHVANHLVVGISPGIRLASADGGYFGLAGGHAMLRAQLHLYGSYANVLRLRARTGHFVSAPDAEWRWDVDARIATHHALFDVGEHPLVMSPYARWEWTNFTFVEDTDQFEALQGGIRLELPL